MACNLIFIPSASTIESVLILLQKHLEKLPETDPIHAAGPAVLSILPTRPCAVTSFAHHKLHVYPFKDVPICWRRVYEEGCLWQLRKIFERLQLGGHENGGDQKNHGEAKERQRTGSSHKKDVLRDIVKLCDMALILTGAPGRRALIDEILVLIDPEKAHMNLNDPTAHQEPAEDSDCESQTSEASVDTLTAWSNTRPRKRQRLNAPPSPPTTPATNSTAPQFPSSSKQSPLPYLERPVPRLSRPSLPAFRTHMHKQATPIILTETISHWHALHRWKDPRYWLTRTHGGRRLVPVEVGRSYTDEGWGQKIMRFEEYLEGYLLGGGTSRAKGTPLGDEVHEGGEDEVNEAKDTLDDEESNDRPQTSSKIGYLAQHDLLTQIPVLRADISVPDYCYISPPPPLSSTDNVVHPPDAAPTSAPVSPSDSEDSSDHSTTPLLNIWLGPAHTISPAHTDPHHNILAQVFGRKYMRLFPPYETSKMYPMSSHHKSEGKNGETGSEEAATDETHETSVGVDMANTSRVDVGAFVRYLSPSNCPIQEEGEEAEKAKRTQQTSRFPLFATAQFVDCILEAGECLYIPRGWWHYVRGLEVGCSVSFWWD